MSFGRATAVEIDILPKAQTGLANGALAEFRYEDDSTTVLHEDIDWDALGQ